MLLNAPLMSKNTPMTCPFSSNAFSIYDTAWDSAVSHERFIRNACWFGCISACASDSSCHIFTRSKVLKRKDVRVIGLYELAFVQSRRPPFFKYEIFPVLHGVGVWASSTDARIMFLICSKILFGRCLSIKGVSLSGPGALLFAKLLIADLMF